MFLCRGQDWRRLALQARSCLGAMTICVAHHGRRLADSHAMPCPCFRFLNMRAKPCRGRSQHVLYFL